MEGRMVIVRARVGDVRSYGLTGIRFQFYKMKVLKVGCKTMGIYFTLLNCAIKNG